MGFVWDCEFCAKAFDNEQRCIEHEQTCASQHQPPPQQEQERKPAATEKMRDAGPPNVAMEQRPQQDDDSSDSDSSSSYDIIAIDNIHSLAPPINLSESQAPVTGLRSSMDESLLFDLDRDDPLLQANATNQGNPPPEMECDNKHNIEVSNPKAGDSNRRYLTNENAAQSNFSASMTQTDVDQRPSKEGRSTPASTAGDELPRSISIKLPVSTEADPGNQGEGEASTKRATATSSGDVPNNNTEIEIQKDSKGHDDLGTETQEQTTTLQEVKGSVSSQSASSNPTKVKRKDSSDSSDQWTKMFKEVSKFKRENKRLPTMQDSKRLFDWISRQVTTYGEKRNYEDAISDKDVSRIHSLDELEVSWPKDLDTRIHQEEGENNRESTVDLTFNSNQGSDENEAMDLNDGDALESSDARLLSIGAQTEAPVSADYDLVLPVRDTLIRPSQSSPNSDDEAGSKENLVSTQQDQETLSTKESPGASNDKKELGGGIPGRKKRPRPWAALALEEFFKLEDEVMAFDNESIVQAEEEALKRAENEEILAATEDWFLSEMDRDIYEAMRREVGEVMEVSYYAVGKKKRRKSEQRLVTEVYWSEDMTPKKRIVSSSPKGPHEVCEPENFSKILPTRLMGKPFLTSADRDKLCEDIRARGHRLVECENNTSIFTVFHDDGCGEQCKKSLAEWLRKLVRCGAWFDSTIPAERRTDTHSVRESKGASKPAASSDSFRRASDSDWRYQFADSETHSAYQTKARHEKRSTERRDHRETSLPGRIDPSQTAYKHFTSKFSNVATIEFQDAGIRTTAVLGKMWRVHKELFGARCDVNCKCVFKVDLLTKDVVQHALTNIPQWDNRLRLKAGDMPLGFAGQFWSTFAGKLEESKLCKPRIQAVDLLIRMWSKHQGNSCYGLVCKKNCKCKDDWDFFNPNQDDASPRKPQRSSRGRSRSNGQDGSRIQAQDLVDAKQRPWKPHKPQTELNKTRVTYDVVFKSSSPMGCFFVNEDVQGNTTCKVKSVFKVPDDRIRVGTTVVGVGATPQSELIPVNDCQELKRHYQRFLSERTEEFICYFKNLQDEEEDDWGKGRVFWTRTGRWKGSNDRGWAGGAKGAFTHAPWHTQRQNNLSTNHRAPTEGVPTHIPMTIEISTTRESAPVEPRSQSTKLPVRNEPSWQLPASRGPDSKCDTSVDDGDEWISFSGHDTIPTQRAPAILRGTSENPTRTGTTSTDETRPVDSDIPAKQVNISFNPKDEIRLFHSDEKTNQFLVLKKWLPFENPEIRLRKVLETDSVAALVKLLDQERLAFGLRSNDALKRLSKINDRSDASDKKMKRSVLNIFKRVGDISEKATGLDQYRKFRLFVEKVSMKFVESGGAKQGEPLYLQVFLKCRGTPHEQTTLEFNAHESFTFPPSSQTTGFLFQTNLHHNPDNLLGVEVHRRDPSTGEREVLGRGQSLVSDLCASTSANEVNGKKTFFIELDCSNEAEKRFDLCKCDFDVKWEYDHHAHSTKRKMYLKSLKQAEEWIVKFNDDVLKANGPKLNFTIPVMGTTLLETAVTLADEQMVDGLLRRGSVLTEDVLNFVHRQAKIRDKYHILRTDISKMVRQWYEWQNRPVEQIMQEPQFLEVTTDWLFAQARSQHYKRRCNNFENGGYCKFSATCCFGHVLKKGSRHPLWATRKTFNEEFVETLCVRDTSGTEFWTAGYIDSNEFCYAVDQGGVMCQATGIYWWKTWHAAISALEDVLREYYPMA